MTMYEGLICYSYRADSCIIPNDMEFKQQLMHNHHDSPTWD